MKRQLILLNKENKTDNIGRETKRSSNKFIFQLQAMTFIVAP